MCLANIAVLLAKWGHKVLMVDWDWEAPGLERYFVAENFNGKGKSTATGLDLNMVKEKPGLVDLLTERKKEGWKEAIITIPIPDAREPLHFISAGRRDDDYFKRVRDFNVDTFYAKKKGGQFIEDLRRAWRDAYDFILIDSRTGVSEINGISTIQMPNLIVLLFTATNQSFEGALDIAYRSASAHQKLPYDRGQLLFLPILSRVEVAVSQLVDKWIARFSKDLTPLYEPWLPTENPNIKIDEFLMRTKIPHDPSYTFGEELAVVRDGTIDPARMGYAYEGIAALIANKLERVEEFVEQRDLYISWGGRPVSADHAPPKFVIIYDIADDAHCKMLNKHLNILKITKKIRVYNVHEALPGEDPVLRAIIEMEDASWILSLVTVDLLNSTDWFSMLFSAYEAGRRIVPIRIAKVDFEGTGLERLRSLPSQGRTVSDFSTPDAAYMDIVSELKKLL